MNRKNRKMFWFTNVYSNALFCVVGEEAARIMEKRSSWVFWASNS